MISSISSLGVYLNTYNTLTLVQGIGGATSTDNSSASNIALSISNILKDSESNSASDSNPAVDSAATSTASDSEDSSSSVSVYA
jgi:hypothetical protein